MVRFDAPINADDTSFKRVVLEAPFPVVAVFWSAKDASRRRLNTTLEETARLYAGEVLVVKLDIADSQRAQAQYSVRGVPQFLLFRDGAPLARVQGVPTVEMLRPWIEYLLGRSDKPSDKLEARAEPPAPPEAPLAAAEAEPQAKKQPKRKKAPKRAKRAAAPEPRAEPEREAKPEPGPTAAAQPEPKPEPKAEPKPKRQPEPEPEPPQVAQKKAVSAAEKPARSEETPQQRQPKTEEPAMEGAPLVASDANFESIVLDADKPALVFFWAEGAPACETVRPIVKAMAWEFADKAVVAQMNVDENPGAPSRFGAQIAPTVIIFVDGEPVEIAADARSARALRGKLRELTEE